MVYSHFILRFKVKQVCDADFFKRLRILNVYHIAKNIYNTVITSRNTVARMFGHHKEYHILGDGHDVSGVY